MAKVTVKHPVRGVVAIVNLGDRLANLLIWSFQPAPPSEPILCLP